MSNENTNKVLERLTAGRALRHSLFNKLTPILLASDAVGDSQTRRLIQDCCNDAVSSIERVILEYALDRFHAEKQRD